MTGFNPENIPYELRAQNQWVAWNSEQRGGDKPAKVPYSPVTHNRASSTEPTDWTSFDLAVAYAQENEMTGVGFVFTADDPYVGIDLDACIAPETGELHPEAHDFVDTFDTYTEISPSGTGLKMIGRGQKPDGARCKSAEVGFKEIEVYDQTRYFTVTTNVFEGRATLRDITDETNELCERWLMPRTPNTVSTTPPVTPLTLDDSELLERIGRSQQGPAFEALWGGSLENHGNDASSADFAMACALAFWTRCDALRIERLMRQCDLARPKWDTGRGDLTYLEYTIQNAIRETDTVYNPDFAADSPPQTQTASWNDADVDFDEFHDNEDSDSFDDHLQSVIQGERRPRPWPWSTLDLLTRALTPGSLTILVGSPGSSKSLMMAQSLSYWYDLGIDASCLMLEGDRNFHLRRTLAQETNNAHLTDDEWVEANPEQIREAYEEHQELIQALSANIDVPPTDLPVGVQQVTDWLEARGVDGKRILVVDPVTMINGGEKQWLTDQYLVTRSLRVAEKYNLSIVLVTHPRKGARKPHLDDVAGGANISRMSHNVLWLERLQYPKPVVMVGPNLREIDEQVDRVLHVLKARSGNGTGRQIGVLLNQQTLRLDMPGIIVENNEVNFDGTQEREALGI